jgi:hypothetical protein
MNEMLDLFKKTGYIDSGVKFLNDIRYSEKRGTCTQ